MTYVLIFLSFEKFANIKDVRRKFNPIVDLSKFTFNKKILSGVVAPSLLPNFVIFNLLFFYFLVATFSI